MLKCQYAGSGRERGTEQGTVPVVPVTTITGHTEGMRASQWLREKNRQEDGVLTQQVVEVSVSQLYCVYPLRSSVMLPATTSHETSLCTQRLAIVDERQVCPSIASEETVFPQCPMLTLSSSERASSTVINGQPFTLVFTGYLLAVVVNYEAGCPKLANKFLISVNAITGTCN